MKSGRRDAGAAPRSRRRSTGRSATRCSRPSRGSATASGSSSGPKSRRSSASWPRTSASPTRSRVVGHRRDPRGADGARHRPGRRSHHDARSRSSPPPAASPASARRRGSSTSIRSPSTSIPRPSAPRSRRGPRRSFRCTCTACAPTWIRSWRSPRSAGIPVIEDACQAIGATYNGTAGGIDRDDRLLLVLSEQEPRRVRRRRAGDDERSRRWRTSCACCAITAPSRSTFTSGSAATSGSMRCRPRCCG